MTLIRFVCILSCVTLCTACNPVYSKHLIGERTTADLSNEFDGIWRMEDSVVYIRQVAPGELRVGGLEWNDETESFDVEELTVILSRAGERQYVNIVDEEGSFEDGPWHIFGQYRINDGVLMVWSANAERFIGAVRNTELDGGVHRGDQFVTELADEEDGDLFITSNQAVLASFIQANDAGEVFMLEEPTVLIRIAQD